MDYAQQQRNPMKHLIGITFVVIVHLIIVWALINGLASRVVDVLKKPIETKIIEQQRPPPPPEKPLPPPPKLQAPPPPYIPPPEIAIQTPPPAPTITTQTTTPPPPSNFQVAPPPTTTAPPRPPSLAGTCTNARQVGAEMPFPRAALRAGIDHGSVVVRFTVSANGDVKDISIDRSTNRAFNETAVAGVGQLKCSSPGRDTVFEWQIDFKSE